MEQQAEKVRPIAAELGPRWLEDLAFARNEREIVSIAREYLATWPPEDLALLPEACRPPNIVEAVQVAEYALVLTREHLAFHGSHFEGLLLDRMLIVMSFATTRIAQLGHLRGVPAQLSA